jgi:hypothetical protein
VGLMLEKIDGHRVATEMAFKVLAQLLHRRGVLDMVEFAETSRSGPCCSPRPTTGVGPPRRRRSRPRSSTSWPVICGR